MENITISLCHGVPARKTDIVNYICDFCGEKCAVTQANEQEGKETDNYIATLEQQVKELEVERYKLNKMLKIAVDDMLNTELKEYIGKGFGPTETIETMRKNIMNWLVEQGGK